MQSIRNTIPWSKWGFELISSENRNEAWQKYRAPSPVVVILDIHMPGLNGLEVARLVQKQASSTLIILLSAYDNFTYAKTGLRLGVFDYLLKPLDTDELKLIGKAAQERSVSKEAES